MCSRRSPAHSGCDMNDLPGPDRPQATGSSSTTDWITTDGTKIQARQWLASKPRATTLLIHGMGDHSGRFDHVARFLNTQGLSVLAPDLRGHGLSDGQRGYIRDFEILLDDIDLALQQTRQLAPADPCFIYGHSLGGMLVILHTLRRQTDLAGLIASSPALRIAMQAPTWKLQLGKLLRRTFPKISLNSGLDLNELSDDLQFIAELATDPLRHQQVTPEGYFGMVESGQWCLDHAADLPCPSLIMHGKIDRITDFQASQQFAHANDLCTLSTWDHGKHELHNMSHVEDVLQTVGRFIETCLAGACSH